LVFRFCDKI